LTPLPVKTKTAGDVVAKIVDSAGSNVAAVDATGHVKVVPDTTFPAAAALTDSEATPTTTLVGSLLYGWDGSNWRRLQTDGSEILKVNVVTTVGSNAPSSAHKSAVTSASLASGANVTMFASAISATTGRLAQVIVASSVPCKWEVGTSANGSSIASTEAILFTTASRLTEQWLTPHVNYVTRASGGGACFEVKVTNMDNVNAADVYATFLWDES
jgi:hypothetical protein